MEIFVWLAGGAIVVVLAVMLAASWGEAVDKRRAWNLWAAGLIDDDELKRRIGEG